nr:MAG TPA_asm: hypothetical protein [Caudoviricetes sp.]
MAQGLAWPWLRCAGDRGRQSARHDPKGDKIFRI